MKDILKDLFWTSYRYCIGRHSYVCSYAEDYGKFFYDKLTDDEKLHYAEDIRRTIEDILNMSSYRFKLNYSIKDKRPYELFLKFLNTLKNPEDLSKISDITAYKKDGKVEYEVSYKTNPNFELKVYEHEILDLQPWADLASLLDISHHKTVTFRDPNGNLVDIECFPSFTNEVEQYKQEGNFITYTPVQFKYKLVWKPVKGRFTQFVNPEDILEIH